MIRQPLIAAIFASLWILVAAVAFAEEEKGNGAIAFDIFVPPETSRHVKWLAYPSYLAIALERTGLNPEFSNNIAVRDGQSLRIDKFFISYIGERGNSYLYTVDIYLPIGGKLAVQVEIDISRISAGKLTVNVRVPLSEYFPQTYRERAVVKFNRFTDAVIQRKLSDYLDGIEGKLGPSKAMESRIELLMIDSYNHRPKLSGSASRKVPTSVEPFFDKTLLVSSAVIVLVMMFAKLAAFYFRRKFSCESGSER